MFVVNDRLYNRHLGGDCVTASFSEYLIYAVAVI